MPKEKLPKFMVAENPMVDSGDYILHNRYPRFLAKVTPLPDGGYDIRLAEEYDPLPADNPVKIAGLMRRMADWYTSLLNYEDNKEYQEDED